MPDYVPPDNDNLSVGFEDIVPQKYKGSDRFLDLVTWNLFWFHHKQEERVKTITDILEQLNADILVFQEVVNESLDGVAEELTRRGAGSYEVNYGTTGGNQRIAIMHDLDWIRTKDDVKELFGKRQVVASNNKDAFPRLPLHGIYTALPISNSKPFDFHLLGLHLKSQRGGGTEQRQKAAERLSEWMTQEASLVDEDVIMTGDWNKEPSSDDWKAIHDLEQDGKVHFSDINDESEISHLMYQNKSKVGTRLDVSAISVAAFDEIKANPEVVKWKNLDAMLDKNQKAKQIKENLKYIKKNISDHMPVVTRFYFTEDENND